MSGPCRCGFTSDGIHRCHAGRGTPDHCPRPAEPGRFFAKPLGGYAIDGMQMKVVGSYFFYCAECWAELRAAGVCQ